MKRFAIIALLATLVGCSTEVDRLTYDDTGVSARTGVRLLREPPRPGDYRSLGERSYSFYRPGFHEPTIADVWDDLSQRIRSAGGDACFVKYQYVSTWTARSIDITCDVLKSNVGMTASSAANSSGPVTPPAAAKEGLPAGKFRYTVDRMLSEGACKPEFSARLISSGAGVETYSGACRNGDTVVIRCEFGQCRTLR